MTVGSNPDGVAYDSGKGEVFVANAGGNTVSVASDSDDKVVATVAAAGNPTGVAYDSAKGEVYVTEYVAGTVSVISDASLVSVTTSSAASTTPTSPSSSALTSSDDDRARRRRPLQPRPQVAPRSSSSVSWNYLALVAANAVLLLALGGLFALRRKNRADCREILLSPQAEAELSLGPDRTLKYSSLHISRLVLQFLTSRRSAIGRMAVAAVVIVLIVVAAVAFIYFSSSNSSSTNSSSTTSSSSSPNTLTIDDVFWPAPADLNQLTAIGEVPYPNWLTYTVYQPLITLNASALYKQGTVQYLPDLGE